MEIYNEKEREFLKGLAAIQPGLNWSIRLGRQTNAQKDIQNRLDRLIAKDKTKEKRAVFRGIADDTYAHMVRTWSGNGLIIRDPAYLSCSKTITALLDSFPYRHILVLVVPAGTEFIDMEKYSESPWQKEILFGRSLSLKVLKEDTIDGQHYIWAAL